MLLGVRASIYEWWEGHNSVYKHPLDIFLFSFIIENTGHNQLSWILQPTKLITGP